MNRIIGLLILSLLFPLSCNANSYSDLSKIFASKFEISKDIKTAGYVVNISDANAVLLSVEMGYANIEHGIPITRDSVFHIASLSKQITAATLAHAIRDGLVKLTDPVSKWIPETKKYGEALRVEHLLFMSSGLTEYTSLKRTSNQPWATFHYFSNEDAIQASLSADSLLFEPGSEWQYSNVNFMIITKIVSLAYKKEFSDVAHEKIFKPLRMRSTLINDDVTQLIPNRAGAYLDRNAGVLKELNTGAKINAKHKGNLVRVHRNVPHYGGSGVMTSMNDWRLWLQ